ncbi:hypothetical protein PVAP13_5KG454207 [Panicum virgatum]|uniref:Uncharacterized protein n=1 Tax=Panicum virgatum TaxID=38727 RepID=A0A8T0STE4_PANVG|nr:hypothetical protein PVAP13_5KG454207 [Panicum virgatum]
MRLYRVAQLDEAPRWHRQHGSGEKRGTRCPRVLSYGGAGRRKQRHADSGGAVSRNGSRTGRRELRQRRGVPSGGRGNGGRRERAVGRSGGVGNGRRERRRDLLATWGHPAALGERPGGGGNGGWPARAGGSRRGSSPGGTNADGAANRAGRRCRAGRAQGNARRRCASAS